MKRFLLLLSVTLVLFGCGKEDSTPTPTPSPTPTQDAITITDGSSVTVQSTESTATVKFTSTADWSASATESWLEITPTSGKAGSGSITVKAKENTGYDQRNASVRISGGTASATATVTQKQKDAILVSTNKIEIGGEGGSFDVELKSNVDVQHSINADWIQLVSTKALSSKTLTFSVTANEDKTKREGTVTFASGNLKEEVKVYQAEGADIFILTQNEYKLTKEAQEIKIEFKSNIGMSAIEIPQEVDWIKEVTTKAASTYTKYLSISENTSNDNREAQMVISCADKSVKETISIFQSQTDSLGVLKTEYDVSPDGGIFEVNVVHNVDFTVDIPKDCQSWIKRVETKGLTTSVIHFEIAKNESGAIRSCEVVIASQDKKKVINIIQTYGYPLTFTSTGSTEISLCKVGEPYDITLEYKINDGGWTSYTIGVDISLNDQDYVSFQAAPEGNSQFSKSSKAHYNFKTSGSGTIAASGNIMSLVDQKGTLTIPDKYYFYQLFMDCKELTTAPKLPATTLTLCSYSGIFKGCTSLISAPELPATDLAQSCYNRMFSDCTLLSNAPELPSTKLAEACYYCMFQNCTSLTKSPKLPATTLAGSCYTGMFKGCTSLTTTPELPAIKLEHVCYQNMFDGCTSLTSAPELPATDLADGCYWAMFQGCTSLVSAQRELPAPNLESGCYKNMFDGCTSLTSAPELPAENLADYCYYAMFSDCILLTSAPKLPAKKLVDNCYGFMFYCCTKLNYVRALFTTIPSDAYTKDWLFRVASTGTFVKSKSATWNVTGRNGIPSGWTVQAEPDQQQKPLTFISTGSTEIALCKEESPYEISVEYQLNKGCWTSYSIGTKISLKDKDQLSFQAGIAGNQQFSKPYNGHYTFKISGSGTVAASGNIMSLVDQSMETYSIPYDDYFRNLFLECRLLTHTPELPATVLTQSCYCHMFQGCTSLIAAPELPATSLAGNCYSHMFEDCTSLTTVPSSLPATALAKSCYSYMFSGCTSLTTAPELPAINLAENCYGSMFKNCKSLTTAPSSLPATTLTYGCYSSMFQGCTTLTTAPELPAKELQQYCYSDMFSGCTSLTTAPKLPATNLEPHCYSRMFNGCISLIYAPSELPATNLAEGCYNGMFWDCTSLATTPKLPATNLEPHCYSYMFYGCTSLPNAPDLPATSLKHQCYWCMFYGCISLTSAPKLSATTLESSCYSYMFSGCSKLNYVKALFTTTPSDLYTMGWLDGVSPTGTFVKNKDATWDVRGSNGIPDGWTVQTE